MAERVNTYLAVAYRWGTTNDHTYHVYCGPDRTKAIALARAEVSYRGGKYACAVWGFDDDGIESSLHAYFKSAMDQEAAIGPIHNHCKDYFEHLGRFLHDMADGKCLLPKEDGSNSLTYQLVECPEYAREKVLRERKVLAIWEEADSKVDELKTEGTS